MSFVVLNKFQVLSQFAFLLEEKKKKKKSFEPHLTFINRKIISNCIFLRFKLKKLWKVCWLSKEVSKTKELLSTNINKSMIVYSKEWTRKLRRTYYRFQLTLKNAKIYGGKGECLYWKQNEQLCMSWNRDYLC